MFTSELCTHLSSVPILWNFLNTLFGPEILHFREIEFLKIVSWNNHAKYDPAELQGLFIPVKFSSLWGSDFLLLTKKCQRKTKYSIFSSVKAYSWYRQIKLFSYTAPRIYLFAKCIRCHWWASLWCQLNKQKDFPLCFLFKLKNKQFRKQHNTCLLRQTKCSNTRQSFWFLFLF